MSSGCYSLANGRRTSVRRYIHTQKVTFCRTGIPLTLRKWHVDRLGQWLIRAVGCHVACRPRRRSSPPPQQHQQSVSTWCLLYSTFDWHNLQTTSSALQCDLLRNYVLRQTSCSHRQDNYVGPTCFQRLPCSRKRTIKNSIIEFSIIV